MKPKWPKLSETLEYDRTPGRCQRCCGIHNSPTNLWIEHDDQDKPTVTVVCLCEACAAVIIEAHPRLYAKIEKNTPVPGAMPNLCVNCVFRKDLSCTHPKLKSNGGKGLTIITPEPPSTGFWDGVDKQGRRTGGLDYLFPARMLLRRQSLRRRSLQTHRRSPQTSRGVDRRDGGLNA